MQNAIGTLCVFEISFVCSISQGASCMSLVEVGSISITSNCSQWEKHQVFSCGRFPREHPSETPQRIAYATRMWDRMFVSSPTPTQTHWLQKFCRREFIEGKSEKGEVG